MGAKRDNFENMYIPREVEVLSIKDESASKDTKNFELKFKDGKPFTYKPGQFVEVSIFGYGEAPISITSSPHMTNLELCIRNMGGMTAQVHRLKVGDSMYVRGPCGNSFPYDVAKGKRVLFVAGGLGLAPLRSLINEMVKNKNDFEKITVLYGARTPGDLLFTDELAKWAKEVEVLQTVDKACDGWSGNVGVCGTLFKKTEIIPDKTVAYVCGPPIMIKFAIKDIKGLGFKDENIITTLERKMQCGVGKCGHCNIGHKYACIDGPVFSYAQLKELPDAL